MGFQEDAAASRKHMALVELLEAHGEYAAAYCLRNGISGYWELGVDPGGTRDGREAAISLLQECVEEDRPAVIFVHTAAE